MKKLFFIFSLLTNLFTFPAYADSITFFYKASADPPNPYIKGSLLSLDTEDDTNLVKFEYKEFNKQKSIYEKKIISIHISRILNIELNNLDNNPKSLQITDPKILMTERPGAFIPLQDPRYGTIKFDKDIKIDDFYGSKWGTFINFVGTILYYNKENRKITISYLNSNRQWLRKENIDIKYMKAWRRESEQQ